MLSRFSLVCSAVILPQAVFSLGVSELRDNAVGWICIRGL